MTVSGSEDLSIQVFKVDPPALASGKKSMYKVRSDVTSIEVQAAALQGGETNMHAHTGLDGTWYVVAGRANFYTGDDTREELIAELGPQEGVFIKRNTPYWFKCVSDENLVLLHVAARARDEENRRINYTDRGRPDLRKPPETA
jgi:mannose-6-phosphate isomerase-like protein (cupin superfamily)